MKKLRKTLIMGLVLVSLGIVIYSTKHTTFAWGSNYEFLDSSFWTTNPNSGQILDALYGTTSVYTKNWSSKGCVINNMTVTTVSSGANTIPHNLAANTVYVLDEGIYTTDDIIWMNDCSAIIAKGPANISSTTGNLGALIAVSHKNDTILDNITTEGGIFIGLVLRGIEVYGSTDGTFNNVSSINNSFQLSFYDSHYFTVNGGKFQGYGPITNASGGVDAINLLRGSSHNILQHVETFDTYYGIWFGDATYNTVDQSKSYNNVGGLWMDGSGANHNLIKNSQFYNNSYYGVYLENGPDYNDFSNIQAFNNTYGGVFFRAPMGGYITGAGANANFYFTGFTSTDRASYNTLTNSQIYNNKWGVALWGADNTILNNLHIYNNKNGVEMLLSNNNILNNIFVDNNKYGIMTSSGSVGNTWYGFLKFNITIAGITQYCHFLNINASPIDGAGTCNGATSLTISGRPGIFTPGLLANMPAGWSGAGITKLTPAMDCTYATNALNANSVSFFGTTSCNIISTGTMFSRTPTQPVALNAYKMGNNVMRQIDYTSVYHFVAGVITQFSPEANACRYDGDPDFIDHCGTYGTNGGGHMPDYFISFNTGSSSSGRIVRANVGYDEIAVVDDNMTNFLAAFGIEDVNPSELGYITLTLQNPNTSEPLTIPFSFLGVNRGNIIVPAGGEVKVTVHLANGEPVVEDGLIIGDDLIAPTITLNGESTVNIYLNDVYADQGAIAADDVDGDITQNIVTDNMVDTSTLGTYHVTYTVHDAANNHAQVIRTVNVLAPADHTPPTITMNGSANFTIYQNDTYADQGATAYDNVDGNITQNITIDNQVNTSIVGTYYVTYTVVDAANNSTQVMRIVEVIPAIPPQDTVAPTIALNGDATVNIYLNDVYVDQGATAYDNVDGNITQNIVVDNQVDTSTIGTYHVMYDISDAANNHTQVIRTVNVLMPADTTPPTITINGGNVNIPQYTMYTDAGATAYDNVDGNITQNIIVDNQVDTNVPGTYFVMYDVIDAANNHTQAIRLVTVSAME